MSFSEVPIKRHDSFWRREAVDAPLVAMMPDNELGSRLEFPLENGSWLEEDGRFTSEMLNVSRFVHSPHRLADYRPGIRGDAFPTRTPCPWIPWAEAVVGCPIFLAPGTGSMWAEPPPSALMERPFPFVVRDEWLEKLLEFTDALVRDSGEEYLVTQTLMRGPMDMVGSLLGDERMCLAIHDDQPLLRRLLSKCTETFIQMVKAQQALIPRYCGGYCSPFGLWAPGTVVRDQIDHSVLVGPQTYEKLFLPFDEEVFGAFDYAIMHVHSSNLQILDVLLQVDSLTAIQVTLDPEPCGPSLPEVMLSLQRILEVKSLLVEGPLTLQEIGYIVDTLSPNGLYIGAIVDGAADKPIRS